jgi:hypothetical protein
MVDMASYPARSHGFARDMSACRRIWSSLRTFSAWRVPHYDWAEAGQEAGPDLSILHSLQPSTVPRTLPQTISHTPRDMPIYRPWSSCQCPTVVALWLHASPRLRPRCPSRSGCSCSQRCMASTSSGRPAAMSCAFGVFASTSSSATASSTTPSLTFTIVTSTRAADL